MPRRKILLWHIHGSYLNALTRVEHDWYLPVKGNAFEGYRGRGGYDLPDWVQDVPAEHVGDIDLDLIIYQTPKTTPSMPRSCSGIGPARSRPSISSTIARDRIPSTAAIPPPARPH